MSSPVSLASSLLALAVGVGLGAGGGGDTLAADGGGTTSPRATGGKLGGVEAEVVVTAREKAEACLFPTCERSSLSLWSKGSVLGGGGGGGGG